MPTRFRRVAAAVVFVSLGGFLAAQEPPAKPPATAIVGVWEGPIKVGPVELRLAFHVKQADGEKLTATMDSIDQGARGIPVKEIAFADGKLTIDMPELGAKFAGKLADDGQSVSGDWEQAKMTFPLTLKRVEKASTLNRPQHPKRPFPYREEAVKFENAGAKVTLAGTLTLPKGDGPFPAVVLVSGSGPQDRDETLFGHKPFLVLADALTRRGVAVLRYDDRGFGASTGKHAGATSADFATDAHAAVAFLRGRKDIDPKRVGIAGHSEGGLIGPMVAADHPADVAFLVLLAGPGIPGQEVLTTQVEALMKVGGAPPEKIDLAQRSYKVLVAEALKDRPDEERKAALRAAIKRIRESLTPEEQKLAAIPKDPEKGDELTVARLCDPWHLAFLKSDPAALLKRVKCPVLAVNGELDLQVLHGPNLAGIEAALKAGGNDRVTVKMFPGLNHLFQTSKTGAVGEYGQIEETFAPAALGFVCDWVAAQK